MSLWIQLKIPTLQGSVTRKTFLSYSGFKIPKEQALSLLVSLFFVAVSKILKEKYVYAAVFTLFLSVPVPTNVRNCVCEWKWECM